MFSRYRRPSKLEATAHKLYGAVVAGARDPSFYRDCGVPDTAAGRYEILVLHVFLLAERIRQLPGADDLERQVVEAFVTDIDDNMREMGVGDVTVHRKVKKATAGLFERALTYRAALLQPGDNKLVEAVNSHVPELAGHPGGAERLATAVRSRATALTVLPDSAITSGEITFV